MTADIFSKRRDDQISTMCQRGLIDRSQHRIINDDNRPIAARGLRSCALRRADGEGQPMNQ